MSLKSNKVKNAILLGGMCAVSYLAVYFARNILSAVSPQMLEDGSFSTEVLGYLSSIYFVTYAAGQLINGIVGEHIKARNMISFGLVLAGLSNIFFLIFGGKVIFAYIFYGLTGFFLSMIYGPLVKVVSENMEPKHAVRSNVAYTFASLFGSPLAGVAASLMSWKNAFVAGGIALVAMGVFCYSVFLIFEKRGVVRYGLYKNDKKRGAGVRALFEKQIVRYTLVSVLTGVIRTAVVFWLPTYLSQYLGFSPKISASIFTAATLIISGTAFAAVFIYELLHSNMSLTIVISFLASAIFFVLTYFIDNPVLNIVFLVLAIFASDTAASVVWSAYCPSLRDTGMVSSTAGFLDCVSYVAAAVSSSLFANAVNGIGWKNLILIWAALMMIGMVIMIPFKCFRPKSRYYIKGHHCEKP